MWLCDGFHGSCIWISVLFTALAKSDTCAGWQLSCFSHHQLLSLCAVVLCLVPFCNLTIIPQCIFHSAHSLYLPLMTIINRCRSDFCLCCNKDTSVETDVYMDRVNGIPSLPNIHDLWLNRLLRENTAGEELQVRRGKHPLVSRSPPDNKPESALVLVDGGEAVSVDGIEVVLVGDARGDDL